MWLKARETRPRWARCELPEIAGILSAVVLSVVPWVTIAVFVHFLSSCHG